jgi:ParB-like chromosome segregation protein Spo0J
MNKQFHEVASIFPMMGKEDLDELILDIQQNGLLEPIWLNTEGLIIDGRNRYLACRQLSLTPTYRTYTGTQSLVSFVVSLNLKRRHLTEGQKAMLSGDIIAYLEKEAQERQREAIIESNKTRRNEEKSYPELFPDMKQTTQTQETTYNLAQQGKETEKKKRQEENESRVQAAKIVGVNPHYVSDAKKITAAAPEVAEVVKQGRINIPDALKIAKLPEQQRSEVLDMVGQGFKPADAIDKTIGAVTTRRTITLCLGDTKRMAAKLIKALSIEDLEMLINILIEHKRHKA